MLHSGQMVRVQGYTKFFDMPLSVAGKVWFNIHIFTCYLSLLCPVLYCKFCTQDKLFEYRAYKTICMFGSVGEKVRFIIHMLTYYLSIFYPVLYFKWCIQENCFMYRDIQNYSKCFGLWVERYILTSICFSKSDTINIHYSNVPKHVKCKSGYK